METSEFEKSLLPSLVKADTKDNACWELTNTSKTGRGICARRDIETNELIFTESHLLCGPIFAALKQRCVSCHIETAQTSVCTRNCGLPLCRHKPACTDTHKAECDLIMSWIPINGSVIRPNIIKALTAIRALLLADERDMSLLRLLQANRVQQNERIISQMISEFQQPPSKEVIEFLQHVVAVLNTNAFQVVTNNNKGSSAVQLKGLYAFAGQLNHDCSPNTRHSVNDGDLLMSVYASRSIKSGEELTTSYTNPLWNTQSRRTHLQMTKQFLCQCRRCQDRTEFGSHLAAVKCLRKECEGVLLPTDAKVVAGQWSCEVCADIMEFGRICSVHQVLANVVQQTLSGSVRSLIDELAMGGGILTRMVPESNQFFVELKLQVVWKLDVTAKGEHTFLNWFLFAEFFLAEIFFRFFGEMNKY